MFAQPPVGFPLRRCEVSAEAEPLRGTLGTISSEVCRSGVKPQPNYRAARWPGRSPTTVVILAHSSLISPLSSSRWFWRPPSLAVRLVSCLPPFEEVAKLPKICPAREEYCPFSQLIQYNPQTIAEHREESKTPQTAFCQNHRPLLSSAKQQQTQREHESDIKNEFSPINRHQLRQLLCRTLLHRRVPAPSPHRAAKLRQSGRRDGPGDPRPPAALTHTPRTVGSPDRDNLPNDHWLPDRAPRQEEEMSDRVLMVKEPD
ncbi:unnamed protein product [Pleuronectes platessa]|uniref:Uncharacterized protein n=1 Tax=Pleuronectes platessa TaxID=8262 RepID=A0A9N7YWC4_PLEPL|nr:unnamed protein product [Pleuronectes platessa]